MRSVLRPRFDYGLVVPWVRHQGRVADATAGPDRVRVTSAVPMRGHDWETLAEFTVRPGDRVPLVLSWAPSHEPEMAQVDAEQALSATTDFWTGWTGHPAYPAGPYHAAVDRSLITLTYEPTGGIVAAATTSLPEEIGGVRNWDYRYCWLRDATYTLQGPAGRRVQARGRRVAGLAAARDRRPAGDAADPVQPGRRAPAARGRTAPGPRPAASAPRAPARAGPAPPGPAPPSCQPAPRATRPADRHRRQIRGHQHRFPRSARAPSPQSPADRQSRDRRHRRRTSQRTATARSSDPVPPRQERPQICPAPGRTHPAPRQPVFPRATRSRPDP